MLRPKAFFVPGIIFLVAAALCSAVRTSLAESVTEDCKSKPDGASPPASHWYYRINREDKRHCWYLGPIKEHSVASDGPSRGDSVAARSGDQPSPKNRRRVAAEPFGLAAADSKPVPADRIGAPQTAAAQTTSAQAEPGRMHVTSGQAPPAARTLTAPARPPVDEPSTATEFAVRWLELPRSSAYAMTAPISSSYAKGPAALDSTEPAPPVAVGPEHGLAQIGPTSASFRPTTVTSTLAIALLLAGAILRFVRRPQRPSRRDRREVAADWLDAYSEIRTGFADMAGRNFAQVAESAGRCLGEAAEVTGRNLADTAEAVGRTLADVAAIARKARRRLQYGTRRSRARPVRTESATDQSHDFKASLTQLMSDMRRAGAAAEPPRAFAPDARHQLRAILARAASRHSESQAFDGSESTQLGQKTGFATDTPPDFSDIGPRWQRAAAC